MRAVAPPRARMFGAVLVKEAWLYDFSLDRKRIILLVSGLVLAAILLFAAGVTVGLAHSGGSHAQPKAIRSAPSLRSAQQPQEPPPAAASVSQPAASPTPQLNPIASAASLAPRQETTSTAQPPRPHAAHAHPKPMTGRLPARTHPGKERGTYFLQAGAFSSEANASALQQRLMHAGYAARVTRRAASGREWYIVTVGHYGSEPAARNAAHRIEQRLGVHPAVRR